MIETILAISVLSGLVIWGWMSIPPEDPEIIKAREEWGKVK